ncbi:MAG: murein biosynthesis integral membrane protein MurJ [Verrucomicrobiales bacterium]
MFRSIFTVGGFTMLSRVLGFVRDKLIASHLGSGAMSDVWVAAFQLPNLFRRVFGEGAFNAAFVPMYSRRLEEAGEKEADFFARRTLSLMFMILMGCFVLSFIFMEPIIRLTNLGFASDGRLEPAVMASRITVVYLVFICLVAGLSGILNSRKVFGAPALAYVVLNAVFVLGLVIVVPRTGEPLFVLCWCVVVAGVLQLTVVLISCLRRGVDLRPLIPKFDSDAKRLSLLMAPGLVSASVQQLNLMVGQTIASLQIGGKTAIFYADRITQLPLGLIGMAAGVVLLPEITRSLRGGDEAGAKRSLSQGLEFSLFLCLPATVAMLVIPREIMYAIFEGGKFAGESAITAGYVLAAFASGTPAYILARVLQPGYFAREDTKTPMRYTIITAVTNMVLVYPFYLWLGPVGCALATSVAGWVNVALLWFGLRGAGFMGLSEGFFSRTGRMLLAALVMGVAVWVLAHFGEPWLMAEGRFFVRLGLMGLVTGSGLFIYLASMLVMRVYSVAELKYRFRRPSRT